LIIGIIASHCMADQRFVLTTISSCPSVIHVRSLIALCLYRSWNLSLLF